MYITPPQNGFVYICLEFKFQILFAASIKTDKVVSDCDCVYDDKTRWQPRKETQKNRQCQNHANQNQLQKCFDMRITLEFRMPWICCRAFLLFAAVHFLFRTAQQMLTIWTWIGGLDSQSRRQCLLFLFPSTQNCVYGWAQQQQKPRLLKVLRKIYNFSFGPLV